MKKKPNIAGVKRKLQAAVIVCFSLISIFSCKKAEISGNRNQIQNVFLIDDSLAHPEQYNTRLATGKNRVYVTHGQGNFDDPNVWPVLFNTQLNVFDNHGNHISHYNFSPYYLLADIMVGPDETVWAAAIDYRRWSEKEIYLIHFSRDGQFLETKTFIPKCISTAPDFWFLDIGNKIHLSHALNGNILLAGSFWGNNTGPFGYFVECDNNGNEIWSNRMDGSIGGFVKEKDAYFTISGYNYGGDSIVFRKYSSTGVELIKKKIGQYDNNYAECRNLIALNNGNLLFETGTSGTPGVSRLMEITVSGDSVRRTVIKANQNRYINPIVQRANGEIVALVNPTYYGTALWFGLTSQLNSWAYEFNPDLSIRKIGHFQTQTMDLLTTASLTSDGRMVVFGYIQADRRDYYKPMLIFLN